MALLTNLLDNDVTAQTTDFRDVIRREAQIENAWIVAALTRVFAEEIDLYRHDVEGEVETWQKAVAPRDERWLAAGLAQAAESPLSLEAELECQREVEAGWLQLLTFRLDHHHWLEEMTAAVHECSVSLAA